jgi:8-oxo-dGTP pyrophosphatase MutT (NUDIX family)
MNCGKSGHNAKICIEPITSCGIICFKVNNLPINKIEKFLFNKYINVEDFNYENLHYINKINFHSKNIKFLMIQRKNSLSYIEFLRGKYNENDINKIINMFELMTKSEIEYIKHNNFETLWNNLWNDTAKSKTFLKEMNISKYKFNYLITNNIIDDLESKYNSPEWGFPKGRRNKYENNNDCANREFIEETNLENYIQFNRINPIEETFLGTNNINYKHIYYLGSSENENEEEIKNKIMIDNYEIGNIGWFTIDEILKLLRPYNTSKINIIHQIYFFIFILNDKISNNKIYNKIKLLNSY